MSVITHGFPGSGEVFLEQQGSGGSRAVAASGRRCAISKARHAASIRQCSMGCGKGVKVAILTEGKWACKKVLSTAKVPKGQEVLWNLGGNCETIDFPAVSPAFSLTQTLRGIILQSEEFSLFVNRFSVFFNVFFDV